MRALHRWTSIVAALVLAFVAVSGLALQAEMLIDGGGGSPAGALIAPGGGVRPMGPSAIAGAPTGRPNERAQGRKLHLLLLGLHRGTYFGPTGVVIDVAAGLSLLFLSVSGIIVYADMLSRRWRLGKRRLFW